MDPTTLKPLETLGMCIGIGLFVLATRDWSAVRRSPGPTPKSKNPVIGTPIVGGYDRTPIVSSTALALAHRRGKLQPIAKGDGITDDTEAIKAGAPVVAGERITITGNVVQTTRGGFTPPTGPSEVQPAFFRKE